MSKDAHEKTINDYLLIVKPSITNKEARKLLMLTSRSTATRILKASNLTYDKYRKHWVRKNS
ncbi:hypothetical protein VBD025_06210 [Virgibacillus flavescens]|uniref:hypothetical protein n=1 Tax=Virgibacillus flavescens TaxID=1611422 RepID=UPI003D340ECC